LLLDLRIYLLQPSLLDFSQAGKVAGGEGVLQGKASSYADLRLCLLVGKLAREGDEIAGL
jgi:hypothetical protein